MFESLRYLLSLKNNNHPAELFKHAVGMWFWLLPQISTLFMATWKFRLEQSLLLIRINTKVTRLFFNLHYLCIFIEINFSQHIRFSSQISRGKGGDGKFEIKIEIRRKIPVNLCYSFVSISVSNKNVCNLE